MRVRAALGAVLVIGALATRATEVRAAAPVATPNAALGPLASGEVSYIRGTFVWTDYAYDDTGANTDDTPGGDAVYPANVERGNAADLVQLQLRFVPGGLQARAVLQTLLDPKVPMLKLTVDGTTFALSTANATVDAGTNTITAVVPFAGRASTAQVSAAVGLASTGQVYDLAFVRGEEPDPSGNMLPSASVVASTGSGHATGGQWQDKRQADVIAGKGDATRAVRTIDLGIMRRGRTQLPDLNAPGYHTWLYYSAVPLGEGIIDGTAGGGLWAGPYQPYLVQLPAKLAKPAPLILYLHGGGGSHLNNGEFKPQGDLDQGSNIVVYPWGREPTTGQEHGYHGASEQDVVDVLADVQHNYAIDARRILSTGTSTGGGGAFRMAQLYPDKFAAVLPLSAYDDTHLIENLTNTLVWMHNGIADPAANQPVLLGTQREFDALGSVDYRSWSVAAHTHADSVAPLTQCLVNAFHDHPTVVDPARVVYTVDPANEDDVVRHLGAYWVSGLTLRRGVAANSAPRNTGFPGYGDAAAARFEATSWTRADRSVVATTIERTGENMTHGADYCSDEAAAQSNDAWREHGIALTPGRPQRTANGFAIATKNFATAAVDLSRMGVRVDRAVFITATTDGGLSLTLRGSWREGQRVRVWRDGNDLGLLRSQRGLLVLPLRDRGTHNYRIAAA